MTNKPSTAKDAEEFVDPLQNYDPKTYNNPLEKALAEDTVTAIQSTPVATVTPDTPVQAAVKALADLEVSCLLVAKDGKLVGLFSDRDVLDRVALEYDQVKDRPVGELMTTDPVEIRADPTESTWPLTTAWAAMSSSLNAVNSTSTPRSPTC